MRIVTVLLLALLLASCRKSAEEYVALADAQMKNGKITDALLNYQNALKAQPDNGEIHRKMARAELENKDVMRALGLMNRAVDLLPGDASAQAELAELCLFQYAADARRPAQLYEKAVELVQQLRQKDPASFDTRRLSGQLALIDRKYEEAIALLRAADQQRPSDTRVVMPLAEAYFAANRATEAETLLRTIIEKSPAFEPAYELLYSHYVTTSRQSEAEALLRTKVEKNPENYGFRVQLAGHYLAGGKKEQGEEVLRSLAGTPAAAYDTGVLFVRLGDPDRAVSEFQRAVKSGSPHVLESHKQLSEIYSIQGKLPEALAAAKAALAIDPKDLEARRLRASVLLDMDPPQDLDTVIADYAAQIKERDSRIFQYQLGRAYRAKGDRAKARLHFENAASGASPSLAAKAALAEMSAEIGKYDETLRHVDEILQVAPRDARARTIRAATLRNLGQYRQARNEANKALAEKPDDVNAQIELGLVSLYERKFTDAQRIFNAIHQKTSGRDVRAVRGLAESFIALNQPQKAMELMSAAVQASGSSPAARFAYAELALRAGDRKLAVEQLQTILSSNPDVVNARVRLGQVLIEMDQQDAGLAELKRAAAQAQNDVMVQLACGTAFHLLGKRVEARPYYQKALETDAGNPMAQNNLAMLLAEERKDLPEALRLAQQAVRSTPESTSFQDTLGYVYLQNGMLDNALQLYPALLKRAPVVPAYRIHYAMVLRSKGEADKARQELETALQNNPNPNELRQIHQLLGEIR
jgi:tetratricopeptide (TPR) repeat protein